MRRLHMDGIIFRVLNESGNIEEKCLSDMTPTQRRVHMHDYTREDMAKVIDHLCEKLRECAEEVYNVN